MPQLQTESTKAATKGVGGRHKLPGQTMKKLNVNAKLLGIKCDEKKNQWSD